MAHLSESRRTAALAAALLLALLVAVAATSASARTDADGVSAAGRTQTTLLISRAMNGGLPNAPSTNGVISNDKRYSRVIAFESEASDLVRGDSNGVKDVFAVLRGGPIGNSGRAWRPGRTVMISRTRGGKPGNGPSNAASVDGSFRTPPTCVGFLSAASNLVPGDTNGQVDAFVKRLGSGRITRLRPRGAQPRTPTTAVAVSGNCKLIAFVTGGKLYVSPNGRRARRIRTRARPGAASFSTGLRNDLVFEAAGGVYLLRNGRGRARLVGRGGRNPVYNDIKRQTVAYEKTFGNTTQIAYHDLGKRERVISASRGGRGNGNSRNPVIGNSGYYVTFETDSGNLQTDAGGSRKDNNSAPDVYLYSDTRKITLVQSVEQLGEPLPGGGSNPSMSFYANYIVFDTPAQLSSGRGNRQVFMRYLGGI